MLTLRDTPGLPDPHLLPPQLAEVGDPFAELRVVPLLLRDIVDRLNAEHVDWSFTRPVVATAVLQLQANWAADYRTTEGILVGDDAAGGTVRIEDSSRVDPWIVRQAERLADDCRD